MRVSLRALGLVFGWSIAILAVFFLLVGLVHAQTTNTFPFYVHFASSNPTGACTANEYATNDSTSTFWLCNPNTLGWVQVGNVTGGCVTVTPTVANTLVFLNGSSVCSSDASATYFVVGSGGELIIKSSTASNGSEPYQIKGLTSGLTAFNTTTTGLYSLFRNSSAAQWTITRDTSTTPINYVQWQNGAGNGTTVSVNGDGFEWSGNGDSAGSGSAAGFKVTNAASTLNTSAGAAILFNAGNAQGSSTSPGGPITFTAGSASGGAAGDNGGPVSFTAGNGSGTNGNGGDVTFTTGNGAGTGRGGNVNFVTGTGSPNGIVQINSVPITNSVGSGTVTTAGTAIGAGTAQAQTGITVTGATTTDVATCAANAAYPATWQTGIVVLPPVVTANTVTVWLTNPTAGSITPAAIVLRCTVTR